MGDDPIVDGLRSRPADERDYDEPLRLPHRSDETAEPVLPMVPSLGVKAGRGRRPQIVSRPPLGAVAIVLLLAVVLALALASGFWARLGAAATPAPELTPTPVPSQALVAFEPTGVVGCPGLDLVWERGSTPPLACEVRGVMPLGFYAATFELDPDFARSPDSTEIHVLVTMRDCHSAPMFGPIAQAVSYRADAVLVTLAIGMGGNDPSIVCIEGARERWTPYAIELSEPLGRRAIYDAEPDPMALIAPAV